jgi:hypothetical protein
MPFHITYYKPVKSASYFSNISATQIYDSPILKRNFSTLNVNPLKTTRILTPRYEKFSYDNNSCYNFFFCQDNNIFFFVKIIRAVINTGEIIIFLNLKWNKKIIATVFNTSCTKKLFFLVYNGTENWIQYL